MPLLPKSVCFVSYLLAQYVTVMSWFFMYFSNVGSWSCDKILRMKTLHCMSWWSSMLDLELYRMYNGLRARDLMPCLCRDFAVIFAIFTKVCRVFCHFLPWFSTVPTQDAIVAAADCCNDCSTSSCLHISVAATSYILYSPSQALGHRVLHTVPVQNVWHLVSVYTCLWFRDFYSRTDGVNFLPLNTVAAPLMKMVRRSADSFSPLSSVFYETEQFDIGYSKREHSA